MGLGENLKGAAKEAVGKATNNDELEQEGSAQQTKGSAETAETGDRVKAQAAEKEADALDKQAKYL